MGMRMASWLLLFWLGVRGVDVFVALRGRQSTAPSPGLVLHCCCPSCRGT